MYDDWLTNSKIEIYLHSDHLSNLSNTEIKGLTAALKYNKILSEIKLSGCEINSDVITKIAEGLKCNHSLLTIILKDNGIKADVAIALATALIVHHTLNTLVLRNNYFRDTGAEAFAEMLRHNHSLINITLQYDAISDVGAIAIAKALEHNDSLMSLDLNGNRILAAGAQALAEALEVNHTLTAFDLGINDIGDLGAIAIAKALKVNDALTTLALYSNGFGAPGVAAIAEALTINHTLITLNLRFNFIDDYGQEALVNALESNYSVTDMGLNSDIANNDENTLDDIYYIKRNKELAKTNDPTRRYNILRHYNKPPLFPTLEEMSYYHVICSLQTNNCAASLVKNADVTGNSKLIDIITNVPKNSLDNSAFPIEIYYALLNHKFPKGDLVKLGISYRNIPPNISELLASTKRNHIILSPFPGINNALWVHQCRVKDMTQGEKKVVITNRDVICFNQGKLVLVNAQDLEKVQIDFSRARTLPSNFFRLSKVRRFVLEQEIAPSPLGKFFQERRLREMFKIGDSPTERPTPKETASGNSSPGPS